MGRILAGLGGLTSCSFFISLSDKILDSLRYPARGEIGGLGTRVLKTVLPPSLNGGGTTLRSGRVTGFIPLKMLSFSLVISKVLLFIPPDLAQTTNKKKLIFKQTVQPDINLVQPTQLPKH